MQLSNKERNFELKTKQKTKKSVKAIEKRRGDRECTIIYKIAMSNSTFPLPSAPKYYILYYVFRF